MGPTIHGTGVGARHKGGAHTGPTYRDPVVWGRQRTISKYPAQPDGEIEARRVPGRGRGSAQGHSRTSPYPLGTLCGWGEHNPAVP